MALQYHEQALILLDGHVRANAWRMGEDLIALARQGRLIEAVMARMRHGPMRRQVADEVVIGGLPAIEYAGKLRGKPLPRQAIHTVDGHMRGEARPHSRNRVLIRPIDEPRHQPATSVPR